MKKTSDNTAFGSTLAEKVIETEYGKISGEPFDGGVRYLGIPYAKPPTGRLRFMPPEAPEKYQGVFRAVNMPKNPPQGSFNPKTQSEDCLRLNIWAPQTQDNSPKAVMFWIYGGSFATGGIGENIYEMSLMARDTGCIIVTANYRLNVCGFLDLREYIPFATANNGLRDIVFALRWVHNNIAHFGGDPENVTVFGQSAGAVLSQALLAVPSAEKLFHKVIAQSSCGDSYYSPKQAQRLCNMWLSLMKYPLQREMINMPMKRLLSKNSALYYKKTLSDGLDCIFNPVIDGEFLTCHPSELPNSKMNKKLLMGLTEDETEPMLILIRGLAAKTDLARELIIKGYSEDFRSRITAGLDYPSNKAFLTLCAERMYRYPAAVFADRYSQNSDLYFYRFDYMPLAVKLLNTGILHATDVPIIFGRGIKVGNAEIKISNSDAAREIGGRMRKMWGNFAKYGAPCDKWEKYEPSKRAVLLIKEQDEIVYDPFGERLSLYYDYISPWKK